LLLPPLGEKVREPVDVMGLALLAIGLGSFTLGIIKGQDWGWDSEKTIASFLIAFSYLIAFVVREMTYEYPLLDFSLFRIRNFSAGILALFIMMMGLAATLFLLPFFLQGIKGLSAEESGYWLLAIPIAITILAPVAGRLSDRLNPKIMMCVGPIIFSTGLYFLSDLDVDVKFWELAPIFSVVGMGMALVMPVAMNVVMTAVPQRKAGMASGTIQTFNSLAQAMGVTFGGVLFTGKMNDLIPNYGNQLPSPVQIKILGIMAAKGVGAPIVVIVEAFMRSFRHVFVSEIPLIFAGFLIILLFLRGEEHLRIVKKEKSAIIAA
jgi:MFS family permease